MEMFSLLFYLFFTDKAQHALSTRPFIVLCCRKLAHTLGMCNLSLPKVFVFPPLTERIVPVLPRTHQWSHCPSRWILSAVLIEQCAKGLAAFSVWHGRCQEIFWKQRIDILQSLGLSRILAIGNSSSPLEKCISGSLSQKRSYSLPD